MMSYVFLKASLKDGCIKTGCAMGKYFIGKPIAFDSNQHFFEYNVRFACTHFLRMSVTYKIRQNHFDANFLSNSPEK